jgi:hypothetical protein
MLPRNVGPRLADCTVSSQKITIRIFIAVTHIRLNIQSSFYLTSVVCQFPPLPDRVCGWSDEWVYVNSIKEPTGSDKRHLSDKTRTLCLIRLGFPI